MKSKEDLLQEQHEEYMRQVEESELPTWVAHYYNDYQHITTKKMKTVNIFKILLRILVQAILPTLFVFMVLDWIDMLFLPAIEMLFCVIVLFGMWFHFVSEHRFKNRKPTGLYKEYIDWFLYED